MSTAVILPRTFIVSWLMNEIACAETYSIKLTESFLQMKRVFAVPKSHDEWKQKGYLYEKHLMEVEATLDWLIKMKNGTVTEADKPTFVSDIQDLLSSDAKQTQEPGGKSRLIQEKSHHFI